MAVPWFASRSAAEWQVQRNHLARTGAGSAKSVRARL